MKVLISGAGIAGPTAAWWLAKAGIDVVVIEKSPRMFAQGQNIDIDGAALTAIKKMGLMEQLRKYNTTEKGTRMIDEHGSAIGEFPLKKGHPSPTSEFEILRGDLAMVLYEATKDHPRIEYRTGTSIAKILSNDDKSVKVELNNGQIEEYDVLIGADGQWSNTRRMTFPQEDVTIVDKDQFVVYFTIPKEEEDGDWWEIFTALKSRNVAIRPDSHGTSRVQLILMPLSEEQRQEWHKAARGSRQVQEELIKRDFADAGWHTPRFLKEMSNAEDFYLQPIQQIKMKHWSSGRVVCVGDAAYAPTALTGSGTTVAIAGAYVLAGELSKLKEGEHPHSALEEYERLYHPHIDKIQDIPSFIPGVVHPNSAWKRSILRGAVALMAKAVSVPIIAKQFGEGDFEEDDKGFPLPIYATLEV